MPERSTCAYTHHEISDMEPSPPTPFPCWRGISSSTLSESPTRVYTWDAILGTSVRLWERAAKECHLPWDLQNHTCHASRFVPWRQKTDMSAIVGIIPSRHSGQYRVYAGSWVTRDSIGQRLAANSRYVHSRREFVANPFLLWGQMAMDARNECSNRELAAMAQFLIDIQLG